MVITVNNLELTIGKRQILRNISLEIPEGAFVGIIGPNGSGKSTLLKCIYRVLQPTGGQVKLYDKVLDELTYRQTALQLAVVAQHTDYNFDFSVNDIVLMGRAPYKNFLQRYTKEDYAIAQKYLQVVGLAGFAERAFASLSGGEQQRVILARALSQETKCIILDEPTNHLDITYQLQILDIIKSMDVTALAAIHDLNLAAMYCDFLIVVKDGLIIGQGTPQELLTPQFLEQVYQVESIVERDPVTHQISVKFIPQHYKRHIPREDGI